jgi:hypothetical protein
MMVSPWSKDRFGTRVVTRLCPCGKDGKCEQRTGDDRAKFDVERTALSGWTGHYRQTSLHGRTKSLVVKTKLSS